MSAWAFSQCAERKDLALLPLMLAFTLLMMIAIPLIRQPDLGQTILIASVWSAMFFLIGLHILWVVGLMALGALGLYLAYTFLDHATDRINRFLNKGDGDTFNTDQALESFYQGGWFGRGPGEGTVKRSLPESHTDFLFAVIGEEYGALICLMVVMLFAFVVIRGMYSARETSDTFCRLAAAGLVMLFGLQSFINMAVNLNLIPPKGMTLPFLSYGGSSLLSVGFAAGMLLAVTRRRPKSSLIERGQSSSSNSPAGATVHA
jgi:cell division protein FtsW